MQLVADVDFDFSYSFIYSPRPGTPAAELRDDTPAEVIKQRLSLLQHRLQQQGTAHTRRMAGTVQRVLVSDYAKKDLVYCKAVTKIIAWCISAAITRR